MRVPFRLLCIAVLLLTQPIAVESAPSSIVRAPSAPPTRTHSRPALALAVQPPRINIGRDLSLHIIVTASGKPVSAFVSVIGAGRPALGTARHGALTLTVHASALG